MMRCLKAFGGLGLLGLMAYAVPAQAVVLWNVPNAVSGTMVPDYQGQPSPFPRPVVKEVAQDAAPDNAALLEAQRKQAYARAKRMVNASDALQLDVDRLRIRGVTNGAQGVRVLMRNVWVGVGEPINVRYSIRSGIQEAIRELEGLDPSAAAELAKALETRRKDLVAQSAKIKYVNIKAKQLVIESPMGQHNLSINLEP